VEPSKRSGRHPIGSRQNGLRPHPLVLILSSHGSPAGIAVQAGRRVEILSPPVLAGLLDGAGVRHRTVIISACYSGVFLGPLAHDDSLVITAADSGHSSFGCQNKVKMDLFRRTPAHG
jgi:hypothetical protein